MGQVIFTVVPAAVFGQATCRSLTDSQKPSDVSAASAVGMLLPSSFSSVSGMTSSTTRDSIAVVDAFAAAAAAAVVVVFVVDDDVVTDVEVVVVVIAGATGDDDCVEASTSVSYSPSNTSGSFVGGTGVGDVTTKFHVSTLR